MSISRRLCYVVSSEMTLSAFLSDHIRAAAKNYEVTVVVNTHSSDLLEKLNLPGRLRIIRIVRQISLVHDLRALIELVFFFRRECFHIVHSVSPKAGLLGMLAATLARVPCRVHTFTGQVWVTRRGWRRMLLKSVDRLLGALTTAALVDSPSQRQFLLEEKVLSAAKAQVIGAGSICGVDAERFRPSDEARKEVRQALGLDDTAVVLLFLGRLNRDKGVLDLVDAFRMLAARREDVVLLLVGPDEGGLLSQVRSRIGTGAGRLKVVGHTDVPQRFMAAADVFCLPSYREGFGQVLVEASACGIPVVASRIYGITDAVQDGLTGILHPPGDPVAICDALNALVADPLRRHKMGEAGYRRARDMFSEASVSRGLMAFYGRILPK